MRAYLRFQITRLCTWWIVTRGGCEVLRAYAVHELYDVMMQQRKDIYTFRGRRKAGPPPKSRRKFARTNTRMLQLMQEAARA